MLVEACDEALLLLGELTDVNRSLNTAGTVTKIDYNLFRLVRERKML